MRGGWHPGDLEKVSLIRSMSLPCPPAFPPPSPLSPWPWESVLQGNSNVRVNNKLVLAQNPGKTLAKNKVNALGQQEMDKWIWRQMKDRGRKAIEGGFFCQGGLSPVWVTEDGFSEFPG